MRGRRGTGSTSWAWWWEGHSLLAEVPMVFFLPLCRANI